jgi:hypothetical protein
MAVLVYMVNITAYTSLIDIRDLACKFMCRDCRSVEVGHIRRQVAGSAAWKELRRFN